MISVVDLATTKSNNVATKSINMRKSSSGRLELEEEKVAVGESTSVVIIIISIVIKSFISLVIIIINYHCHQVSQRA